VTDRDAERDAAVTERVTAATQAMTPAERARAYRERKAAQAGPLPANVVRLKRGAPPPTRRCSARRPFPVNDLDQRAGAFAWRHASGGVGWPVETFG